MNETNDGTNERDRAMRDLQTIKSFLEEGQRKLEDNGFHFIFWGLLIPLGMIAYRIGLASLGETSLFARYFWAVLAGSGGLVSFVVGSRTGSRAGERGFAEKLSGSMWVGHLMAIAVLFVVQYARGSAGSVAFLSSVAIILGLAYWLYGSLIGLAWFKLVGPVWWISAVVMAFTGITVASTILAATTFVCSFVPGCVLFLGKRSGRRQ